MSAGAKGKVVLAENQGRLLLEKLISASASQEILRILLNPNVHYRVHNSPTPDPILCQINPVHVPPASYFLKIHFNSLLLFAPGTSKLSLSVGPPRQNSVCTSPSYVLLAPPIPFFLVFVTGIICEEYRKQHTKGLVVYGKLFVCQQLQTRGRCETFRPHHVFSVDILSFNKFFT